MRAFPRRFSEWQNLAAAEPAEAARDVIGRIGALPGPSRRSMIAWQPSEETLVADLRGPSSLAATTRLRGIPYVIKDLFDVVGSPTYAGSTFLPEVRRFDGTQGLPAQAKESAIVTALRAAGAACAGKTHLHEFAFGNTGENPHYGDCAHPRFPDRLAGGSSSGSAAAVAAGIVPFAIGTDTAGSIRGPAAFCGIFGFRLTPKHEWIRDAFPLAPSFDTPGWFTGNARDLMSANAALVGATTASVDPTGCYLEIGELDPAVAEACRLASSRLCAPADAATGSQLRHAFQGAGEAYSVLSSIEAAEIHRPWLDSHRARYSAPVWERIDRGRKRTPEEESRAQVRRTLVHSTLASYFLTYGFLVLPAVPLPALTKAQCTVENRTRMLDLCAPASLAGLPALTVPVSLPNGLTAGLQIIAPDVKNPVFNWALDLWRD